MSSLGICDTIVFAPHPDDEAFGCAGLIYENIQKNRKVKIVIITNGDGDKNGCESLFRKNPTPKNYIEMGYMRQNESKAAMGILGLSPTDITFLGYPDNGLYEILKTDKYDENRPYKSEFTGLTHTSFNNSYSKNVPYCKESIVRDIRLILEEYSPIQAYITHPNDGHSDHSASGEILRKILRKSSKPTKVFGYYISMAKRPTPKGALYYKTTQKMIEKRLKKDVKKIKLKCLQQYKSQISLLGETFLDYHSRIERFWKI